MPYGHCTSCVSPSWSRCPRLFFLSSCELFIWLLFFFIPLLLASLWAWQRQHVFASPVNRTHPSDHFSPNSTSTLRHCLHCRVNVASGRVCVFTSCLCWCERRDLICVHYKHFLCLMYWFGRRATRESLAIDGSLDENWQKFFTFSFEPDRVEHLTPAPTWLTSHTPFL